MDRNDPIAARGPVVKSCFGYAGSIVARAQRKAPEEDLAAETMAPAK